MSAARAAILVAVIGLVTCVVGAGHARDGVLPPAQPVRYTSVADPWAVKPTHKPYRRTPTVLDAPAPARLTVPAIGVDTPLVPLGLTPAGVMEVPTDFAVAGWYTLGPRPGENGPAVIAGHIDSTRGPAVFARLHELTRGNEIVVTRANGSRVTFVVTVVQQYAKNAFPTAAVFGATLGPELRLITCGGAFDFRKRSYVDNVVVYAAPKT